MKVKQKKVTYYKTNVVPSAHRRQTQVNHADMEEVSRLQYCVTRKVIQTTICSGMDQNFFFLINTRKVTSSSAFPSESVSQDRD